MAAGASSNKPPNKRTLGKIQKRAAAQAWLHSAGAEERRHIAFDLSFCETMKDGKSRLLKARPASAAMQWLARGTVRLLYREISHPTLNVDRAGARHPRYFKFRWLWTRVASSTF